MILYRPPCPIIEIFADINNFCIGTTVTVTSTIWFAGIHAPHYVWHLVRGGSTSEIGSDSSTLNYALFQNNDQVYCELSTHTTCDPRTSNTITISVVSTRTPALTIGYASSGLAYTCAGTQILYYSSASFPGTTPSFQWKTDSAEGGSFYNITDATESSVYYTPIDAERIKCTMSSSAWCVNPSTVDSNILTMTITANSAASVAISPAPSGTVCAGTTVIYTAVPTNGGISPTYVWYVTGSNVGTADHIHHIPINNDEIKVVMTSSLNCKTGSPATALYYALVESNQAVSVEIESTTGHYLDDAAWWWTDILDGTYGYFYIYSKTGVNCTATEVYSWHLKRGATTYHNVSATNTYIITDPTLSDQIWCEMTSSCNCVTGNPATSHTININKISSAVRSVEINTDDNNICTGHSVVFSATASNFTYAPHYQWKRNAIDEALETNRTWTETALVNNDSITCECHESSGTPYPTLSPPIIMLVNPYTEPSVSIGISFPSGTICSGVLVGFSSSLTNCGTSPTYLWYKNNISTGVTTSTYQSNSLVNGDKIKLIVSNTDVGVRCHVATSATSDELTLSITTLVPTIGISANGTCINSLGPTLFSSTITNGGVSPTYAWKRQLNGEGSFSVVSTQDHWDVMPGYFTGKTMATVYCEMTSSATCADPNPAISSFLSLYPCPCEQGPNLINNGGGSGTTDWENPTSGLAQHWTNFTDLNWYSPCAGVSVTHTNNVYSGGGFSGNYQQFSVTLWDCSCGGIQCESFVSTLGPQKYEFSMQYQCLMASELAVHGFFVNASDVVVDRTLIYNGYSGSIKGVNCTFLITNTASRRLAFIIIAHSEDFVGQYTFTANVDEINLWECPQ